jgi:hypothetical protein
MQKLLIGEWRASQERQTEGGNGDE